GGGSWPGGGSAPRPGSGSGSPRESRGAADPSARSHVAHAVVEKPPAGPPDAPACPAHGGIYARRQPRVGPPVWSPLWPRAWPVLWPPVWRCRRPARRALGRCAPPAIGERAAPRAPHPRGTPLAAPIGPVEGSLFGGGGAVLGPRRRGQLPRPALHVGLGLLGGGFAQ